MKKNTIKLTTICLVAILAFSSCANTEKNEKSEQQKIEQTQTSYYCPMKCEGEKTYSAEGSCPKCGMDLVKKK